MTAAPRTTTLDYEPRRPEALGTTTARGLLWLVGQTLGSKVVGTLGQIVLAWLLTPDEFGLIALAYTVSAFANLLQQGGLREILVQRQRHFTRWANAAFWMSMAMSFVAASAMAIAAPVAARLYKAPGLTGLVLVLALTTPAMALSVVPAAQLQIQLRFRAQAALAFLVNLGTIGLSIMLAWADFGAYSFVLPRLAMALLQAAATWWLSRRGRTDRTPIRARPQLRRWRYLIGDSAWMIGASVCYTLFAVGDYMALGMAHDEDVVGMYYFAFNLSTQAVALITVNLWGVLMPALSKLQDDPGRQLRAFLSAGRLMALVSVPCGLMQAALAEPLVRLCFAPTWHAAIPILQTLSIGMTFMMIGAPAATLLQAQGRFKALFRLTLGSAVGFVALVAAAAVYGGALAMGVAVAVFYAAYGAVSLYASIRPSGGSYGDVRDVYVRSLAAGTLSIGAAYALSLLVPGGGFASWLARGAIVASLGTLGYLFLARLFAPGDWWEFIMRTLAVAKAFGAFMRCDGAPPKRGALENVPPPP